MAALKGTVPPLADSASYTVTLTATADTEMATLSFTIGVAQGPAPVADEIAVMEGATAVTMTAASQSSIFANDLGLTDMGDTRSLDGYVVGNTYPSDGTTNVLAAGANAVGTYGTLVINADGSFTYTLDNTADGAADRLGAGDEEKDVFTYRVSDGQATTMAANATVTVTVQGVNDVPVYTTSTFTDSDIVEMGLNVGGDSMGAGNFTGTDVDGDTLGAQVQNPDDMSWGATAKGKFGTLRITGTAWTYELDDDDDDTNGLAAGDTALGESFMVRLTDGNGGESAAAALAITTIMGSNDAPALAAGQNEYPDTVIMPGMAMSAIAGGRYADPESGTTLAYTAACADAVTTATLCGAGGALPAWVAISATDGSFGPGTGTVPDPFNGTMNITVTIADSEGGSVMDTFAITHRDLDPVVNADALTITEGGNDLTGNVYANDTGVRGHPMDVTTLAGYSTGNTFNAGSATTNNSALRGAYGSLTIMNDGAYTYSLDNTAGSAADMLAGGQMVMDVFTYRVSDKAAGTPSGDGVITVTITGVNDAPVEVADMLPSAIDGTQSVPLVYPALPDFATAFSDAEGDTLTITAVASGLPAGLTYTAATRTLSGTPTATGAGTITVTANDGNGGTATVTIMVRVSARPGAAGTIMPPTMTLDGMSLTNDDAEVDSDENAANHGVQLKATAFGYQDMDARLKSVTITSLPVPTSGRLVLLQGDDDDTGVPVTKDQEITREDLDAGNLVIVSNTSNGATVSFTFTTTGTEGNEATAIDANRPIGERTSTTMIGGKESMPEALTRVLTRTDDNGMKTMETVVGVGVQQAYVGRDFIYTIRLVGQTGQLAGEDVVWTRATADFDPVDYDQDLTITLTSATCAATVAEGCTMGASADWLEVMPTPGTTVRTPGTTNQQGVTVPPMVTVLTTASYTLRSKPDRDLVLSDFGDYTVALRITDGTTVVTDTFTLQVNRLPIYGIADADGDGMGDVRHENDRIVFTVVSENGLRVPQDLTMKVVMTSPEGYVTDGSEVDVTFTPTGPTSLRVTASAPMARRIGPGGTVTATVKDVSGDMNPGWEQGALASGTVEIVANDVDVRNDTVRDGLSGYARAMGWDIIDSVSKRSTTHQQGDGKQVDMSALTQRLTGKLTSRLAAALRSTVTPAKTGTQGSASEITGINDALNHRANHRAATEAAGQGIHGAFTLADGSGGNLGTVSGTATDVKGWLLDIGTRQASGALTGTLDGIYSAAERGMAEGLPKGMNVWTDVSRSNIKFGGGSSASYDGHMFSLRVGIEKEYSPEITVGVLTGRFDGDLDHNNVALRLSGAMGISGWNINPYLLWSSGQARAWVTVGVGKGDLNYSDRHTGGATPLVASDASDIDMNMMAAGTEYSLLTGRTMEVLGRFELMSTKLKTDYGDRGLFTTQKVNTHGARGEMEIGWPMGTGGDGGLGFKGDLRPYITVGYRWDGGDGVGGNSVEFGAGVVMLMENFNLDLEVRSQTSSDDEDFDRDSVSFSFSYDAGNDKQGMMLTLSQDRGVAELDPFAQYSAYTAADSSDGADRLNVQAGYGFALDNGLLTFHTTSDFNGGVQGRAAYGLTLETFDSGLTVGESFGGASSAKYELLFTTNPASTASSAASSARESEDAVLLIFTKRF